MKDQAYPEIGIDDLVVISTPGSSMADNVTAGAVEDIISISAIDSIDLGAFGSGYGINYPNTLSVTNANISVSNGGTGFANSIFTINDTLNVHPSSTIDLRGDDADIRINGESLMETLNMMKQRLAWLDVRSDLESEWAELRELGDRYRELVANIEDKIRMWDTLKKMPPPIIP